MDNQGKTDKQLKASYIGVFAGFVGLLIVLLSLMFK